MVIIRKKDGSPNIKFFESVETTSQFDVIRNWLLKNCKKYVQTDPPTNKSLVNLVIQLVQFQEDAFGKQVSKAPLTRLPMRLFLDFKSGGALCHILATVFKTKVDQGWRRFDFQSPSRMDRNVEMLMNIEKALLQNKLLTLPCIYIRSDVDKALVGTLKDIVIRHKGTIADSPDKATHIIHPPPTTPPEGEWIRPVIKRERALLLHWWYTPDSYDTWMTGVEVEQDPLASEPGPYEVTARWVLDTDEFNEWMNEEDYDVTDNWDSKKKKGNRPRCTTADIKPATEDKRKNKGKRKRSPSPPVDKRGKRKSTARAPSICSKRLQKEEEEEEEEEEAGEEKESPASVPSVHEVTIPLSKSLPKGEAQPSKQPAGAANGDKDGSGDAKGEQKGSRPSSPAGQPTEEPEKGGLAEHVTEQIHHIIIPSYAAWFDYNSIHAIERRALPEFFNSKNRSKTPEIYLAYRNFVIDTYRLNPLEYLTSTACRRNLAGDVCAIMRVHAFLEQWGLINYQVDAECRPAPMGPPPTSHFCVLGDTPSGIQPLQPKGVTQPSAAVQVPVPELKAEILEPPVQPREGEVPPTTAAAGPADGALTGPMSPPAGKDGAPLAPNLNLREDQYVKQFTELKGRPSKFSRDWTDQETLMLLEGLEMFKDDWNKVSEHVGTRTQDECILQFLQLPIEDPYIENVSESIGGAVSQQPIPFSQHGNPVMSTVAFLASIVDPRVAGAATKTAMEEFNKLKDEVSYTMIEQHMNRVKEQASKTGTVDASFGLEDSGIAGTGKEETESMETGAPAKEGEAKGDKSAKAEDTEAKADKEEATSKDGEEPMEAEPAPDIKKEAEAEKPEEEATSAPPPAAAAAEKDGEEASKDQVPAEEDAANKMKTVATRDALINEKELQVASSAALATAAVKAKHLAAVEERKIKSLVALLVETQMKKLEIKLRHFEELEAIMDQERESVS
ncbi:PREDICTED: SWI/SNF complex subunit SMARCC2-like [Priapulus caudatus]|uniref:SWI/SNF complex subunit SMARCC2-like n=1 Tax=Priapulus caudatus TaxID=37621 RepID=A0ABM1E158_PRICU|nr:PREDICTED: SWI/SNF complex subunit SMARCC2-like [Priapulus caudatus]